MLNYTLRMIHGYDVSYNACMYCDYISGPFLTSSKTLLGILNETEGELLLKNTSANQFYLDMFMQVHNRLSTMMCPDVMFHTKQIGFPAFMDKYDVEYTIHSGTLLGAVKVSNSLSWERDHDARIRRTHFSKFHRAVQDTKDFDDRGYRLRWDKCANQTKCIFDSVSMHTQNWRLEFFAKWQNCNPNDIWNEYAGNITKTRIQMGNYWLISYPNPAGAARNFYGPNMFEHVEHYSVISTSSDSHINYGEGRWHKCPKRGFHGCLDNFLPMGNIQFKEVWI